MDWVKRTPKKTNAAHGFQDGGKGMGMQLRNRRYCCCMLRVCGCHSAATPNASKAVVRHFEIELALQGTFANSRTGGLDFISRNLNHLATGCFLSSLQLGLAGKLLGE